MSAASYRSASEPGVPLRSASPGTIAYELEGALYLNLTNRCTAECTFCARTSAPLIGEYDLRLSRDPCLEELRAATNGVSRYRELVFCGYGEPTLRLKVVLALAEELKSQGVPLRLNTNGHGNLIHRRDIVPDIARRIQSVSVSLNAPDAKSYLELCRPRFGIRTFDAILDFTRRCRELIPHVMVTVVDTGEIDLVACQRVADELGVPLRMRRFYKHISDTNRFISNE